MKVQVLSPGRPLADVDATSVSVPASEGFMELLDKHAPIISEIDCGPMVVTKASNGERLHFFVAGGYAYVSEGRARILVDVGESIEEIDPQRAASARERATQRLSNLHPDVDLTRALFAQRRAEQRLDMAKKSSSPSAGS